MGRTQGSRNRIRNKPTCHPNREHEAHGLCKLCYMRKYNQDHPEDPKTACIRLNALRENLKREVLTHYGKCGTLNCCWKSCTVSDLDMLSLDHKDNDGAQYRHFVGKGTDVYRWAKKHNYPKGLQTLCGSHQLKKLCVQKRRSRKYKTQGR